MKNEFAPYDLALAMKELGFDEKCFGFYSLIHDLMICNTSGINEEVGECLAPLYQQAFRWFREKHNHAGLIQLIEPEYGGDYGYVIYYKLNHLAVDHWNKGFKTYEEAELACLRKLIEIVNQNKDENKHT